MLSSASGYEASTFTEKNQIPVTRQGLIPSQISILGEVSLLARVCPESPYESSVNTS
jgi:hypothetical protein